MKPIPTELVFLAAKRTPFGTYGGALKDQSATDLGVHAAKAALKQSGIRADRMEVSTRLPMPERTFIHRWL